MIMPANYSVIAENELSYVNGGFVDPITSVKVLEKNIVEAIGRNYAGKVLNAFIGQWFVEDGKDNVVKNVFGAIGDLFTVGTDNQGTKFGKFFKGVRNTIGVLGGIYVLGMYDDAVTTGNVANIEFKQV